MHSQIIHNGRLAPVGPCLSPGQLGLLGGWGVFTTLRIYSGVPFAYEYHWERMTRDAGLLRVELPYHAAEIRGQLSRLVEANGAQEGAARIYFIRNGGNVWSMPAERETDYLIFTAGLPAWGESARLTVTPQGRHAASSLAGVKVLSWISNLATADQVHERGFDETILLNERGEVAECTAANVFIVRNGTVLTPPLDSGCLPGVTRRVLLEAASAAGIEAREQVLRLDDLPAADEVFISSTTREVLPVREIDGRQLRQQWPASTGLRAVFRDYVRRYVERNQRVPARA